MNSWRVWKGVHPNPIAATTRKVKEVTTMAMNDKKPAMPPKSDKTKAQAASTKPASPPKHEPQKTPKR